MAKDQFTAEQQAVIEHPQTPLLVLAGPGSGKTLALTHRCAWLIRQGVEPHRLFVSTFTRKAANELRERLVSLVGHQAGRIDIGTFHSLSSRWLKRRPEIAGRGDFTIYDDYEALSVMQDVMRKFSSGMDARTALERVSFIKASLLSPNSIEDKEIADIYDEYEKQLSSQNALDFADLVAKFVQGLHRNLSLLQEVQDSYDHILVDEYQDINYAQENLIRLLASRHRRITCVGDPDQGIFSFQGGNLEPLITFSSTWPDAKVLGLTQNFRSPGQIVKAATSVIRRNKTHQKLGLWTSNETGDPIILKPSLSEASEASWIADQVKALLKRGTDPQEIAILFRLRWLIPPVEQELMKRKIPFTISGARSFIDYPEIREAMAFLRLLSKPDDAPSFRQVASLRRISHTVSARVLRRAKECNMSPFDYIQYQLPFEAGYKPWEIRGLKALAGAYNRLITRGGTGLKASVEHLGKISKVLEGLNLKEDEYLEATVRLGHMAALAEQFEAEYEDRDSTLFEGFVAYLDDSFGESEEADDAVQVLTIHRSKGLEFQHVFLIGSTSEVMPHRSSIVERGKEGEEEERRLFYVALTRAKQRAYITWPLTRQYFRGTRIDKTIPSPFLSELPKSSTQSLSELPAQTGGAVFV